MPAKQHIIKLTSEERAELEKVSQSNRRSVREKTRARILLGSGEALPREEGGSLTDLELANFYKVNPLTVDLSLIKILLANSSTQMQLPSSE